jgi:hypothetical protein
MNVQFWMAVRARVIYEGRQSLFGAILDRADNDDLVVALDLAAQNHRGSTNKPALDAIELCVANSVDAGEELPITNEEGWRAARWAASNLAALPDPIPRGFVLYLAHAQHQEGAFPTLAAALRNIFANRTMA